MALLTCPICERTFDSQETPAMPFCSERCRLIDLKRWLNEEYRLPIERDTSEANANEHVED
jgi:hypothetical protein